MIISHTPRFHCFAAACLSLLLGAARPATGAPLPGDIGIHGMTTNDTLNSFALGGASHSGDLVIRIGGADTTTSFSNGVVQSGSNPLAGTLTDTGDGLGILAWTAYSSGASNEFMVGVDQVLTFTNSSLTDTWLVTLGVTYTNRADGNVTNSGADAYIKSEFTLDVDGSEAFFTEVVSDLVFGDELNGAPLGTFGEAVNDAGATSILVTVFAGASVTVDSAWTMEGETFTPTEDTFGAFNAFVTIADAINLTTIAPMAFTGRKFEDLNGDGTDNGGTDPAISNVTIELWKDSGDLTPDFGVGDDVLSTSVVTLASGMYSISNTAAGLHFVREQTPPGMIQTAPTNVYASTPVGGVDVTGLDFGNAVYGSIHGFKYEDVDGDGVYSAGTDLPLAGAEFTLTGTDGPGHVINQTSSTDLNGRFVFTNLLPSVNSAGAGTGYTLTETVPAGHVATTPTAFTSDLLSRQELVVNAGDAGLVAGDLQVEAVVGTPLMFGNTVPGSMHGLKFNDVNGDGIYSAGTDLPLTNVQFTLTGTDSQGNVLNATTFTDTNGWFGFTGLLPSVSGAGPATGYTVTETVPTGYLATTPTSFSSDLRSREELAALPGQAMLPPPLPTTLTFDDVDALGGPVTGDALTSYLNVRGITISDITPSGLPQIVDDRVGFPSQVVRAFTDFNVFWHDSPNAPYAYTLNFATPHASFSFVRPELFGATPSGLIVSPWRARAFDASGTLLDTVSEPLLAFFGSTPAVPFALNGPGITAVIFDRTTPNTIAGLNRVPTDNWIVDVPTDPRREILVGAALMFGNTVSGSIHGFKFEDVDGDGVYTPGTELPLANVPFSLSGTNGAGNAVSQITTTDTNGLFSFAGLLPSVAGSGPGTGYTVAETIPTGFVATTPTSFSTDLLSGQELVARAGDAGLLPGDPRSEVLVGVPLMFGNTVPGSIHGFKFDDVDGNGIYTPGTDLPLSNMLFTLSGVDSQGSALLGTVSTDANGTFSFTGLLPSVAGTGPATGYTITESLPIGVVATTPLSFSTNLLSRQALVARAGDAGLLPGDPRSEVLVGVPLMFGNTVPGSIHGFKFEDVDGDGIYTAGSDLPLADVAFTLTGTDGQGNVVNTTSQTDVNGRFALTGLLPSVNGSGSATGYTLTETVPPGFVATTPISLSSNLLSRQALVVNAGDASLPPFSPRVEVVVGASLMFGNTVPGSIHGFKFEDMDLDGVYSAGTDLPLGNVPFTLTGTDGQGNVINMTETTGVNGQFGFTGLLPSANGVGSATGYTVTETVPAGYVATTPTSFSSDLRSRQELAALPGQAMLPPPLPTTLTFDDVDALGGPITGDALTSYLNVRGITISDITPSGLPQIVDDRVGFPSQVVRAFTDFNVFWHDSPNAPYAYTLNFATPHASFSFVRPELFGATPSGLIVSPWRARAFDASGTLLDTVSEPQLAFFGATPPVPFTLNGPGITAVIFDRTTINTIAGLNRVPTDNWIVDVPTDPRREILVGAALMFGNASLDFGDAPDPTYPTLLASDGARHALGGALHLGALRDAETNGLPTVGADGDDLDALDDEDGVTFLTPLQAGQTTDVSVVVSANGLLDVWLDLNRDGDWSDAGEQLLTSAAVVPGANVFSVPIGKDATAGLSYARFRLSTAGGLAPTGLAADGEVEDYTVWLLGAADLVIDGAPAQRGAPTPLPYGAYVFPTNSLMTNCVASPADEAAGTRYRATGWTGTGSVPASGTGTCAVFTLDVDSTLTWNWQTQHYLDIQTPTGSVSGAVSGWYDDVMIFDLTADPAAPKYAFDYWLVNGANAGSAPLLTVTSNVPVTVEAVYRRLFADVTTLVTATFDNWYLNFQTGTMFGELTLCNSTTNVVLIQPFWYAVAPTPSLYLVNPDGTTNGLEYVDITAKVLAALPLVGDGNAALDPGECVTIADVEWFSSTRVPPNGQLFAVYADPPGDGGTIDMNARDTDGDGAPNWWEEAYGLNRNDPRDAAADLDHDGMTGAGEYAADTDPTRAESVLRFIGIAVRSNGVGLRWTGGEQVTQYLYRATDVRGPWIPLLTNVPPTAVDESFDVPRPPDVMFYRLGVPQRQHMSAP